MVLQNCILIANERNIAFLLPWDERLPSKNDWEEKALLPFSSETLGKTGSTEELGGGQGKQASPSGGEHADSAGAGGSLAQRRGCMGRWVGGWGGGWETTAPRCVGSCSSSSELGRLKESLNVGSGSLSWVHDFSITCFPFQMLQLSEPCICCHSERTQLRQQMLAFILTEVQIKIRAGQSCIVLRRTLLSLQWLSPTQWKSVLLERYVLWMAHRNLPWGTAPRTGATGTWQRDREYKKKMHKCRKGSSFVSWLRRLNGVWR